MVILAVGIDNGALEVAVIDFDCFEQAALEVMQPHLDFIRSRGLAATHFVGQPQGFDLQLQFVDQVIAVKLAQTRVGELIDNSEYLALMVHDRTSPRFGRMCGEHRFVQQVVEQGLQVSTLVPWSLNSCRVW